jgi:hypothetical protein
MPRSSHQFSDNTSQRTVSQGTHILGLSPRFVHTAYYFSQTGFGANSGTANSSFSCARSRPDKSLFNDPPRSWGIPASRAGGKSFEQLMRELGLDGSGDLNQDGKRDRTEGSEGEGEWDWEGELQAGHPPTPRRLSEPGTVMSGTFSYRPQSGFGGSKAVDERGEGYQRRDPQSATWLIVKVPEEMVGMVRAKTMAA